MAIDVRLWQLSTRIGGPERLRSARRSVLMAWRRFRHRLTAVHPTFYMAGDAVVFPDLVAREYSYIGPGCMVWPRTELGPYVMLGPRVAIVGGDHRFDIPGTPIIFSGRPEPLYTVIEADAWLGYGAIVMAGTRVGRGAIIAAGSVVTRDVEPYAIVAGTPARTVGTRFADPADRARHDAMLSEPPKKGTYAVPLHLTTEGS